MSKKNRLQQTATIPHPPQQHPKTHPVPRPETTSTKRQNRCPRHRLRRNVNNIKRQRSFEGGFEGVSAETTKCGCGGLECWWSEECEIVRGGCCSEVTGVGGVGGGVNEII